MTSDTESTPICAGCGELMTPEQIGDDILCPACLDAIAKRSICWAEERAGGC